MFLSSLVQVTNIYSTNSEMRSVKDVSGNFSNVMVDKHLITNVWQESNKNINKSIGFLVF